MRTLGAPDGSHITIIQRNGVHKAIAMVPSIIIPFSNSSDMISHHAAHSRRVRFSKEVLHCYCPERTTSAAVKRSLYYDADNFSKMRKDATATAYSRHVRDGGIKLRRMCVNGRRDDGRGLENTLRNLPCSPDTTYQHTRAVLSMQEKLNNRGGAECTKSRDIVIVIAPEARKSSQKCAKEAFERGKAYAQRSKKFSRASSDSQKERK